MKIDITFIGGTIIVIFIGSFIFMIYSDMRSNDVKRDFCASKDMSLDINAHPEKCFTSNNGELVTYFFTQKEIDKWKEGER